MSRGGEAILKAVYLADQLGDDLDVAANESWPAMPGEQRDPEYRKAVSRLRERRYLTVAEALRGVSITGITASGHDTALRLIANEEPGA